MGDSQPQGMRTAGFTYSITILVECCILFQVWTLTLTKSNALGTLLRANRPCKAGPCCCLLTWREASCCHRRLEDHRTLRCLIWRASCESNGPRRLGLLVRLERYWRVSAKRVLYINIDIPYQSRLLTLMSRAFDGKAKVWSIDQRSCVATHTETDKTLWSVKWLPKTGRSEGFATAGANRSISFYREATGG